MRQPWARLLAGYGVAPAPAERVLDQLRAAYAEPQRHYHNLEHIAEMLAVAARLAELTHDRPALQVAIWFHDAVYDPKAKDNEERSAELVVQLLGPLGVPSQTLDRVVTMIRATQHTGAEPDDPDIAVLLDADLAILGAEETRYAAYASAIRKEYAWVDEAAYRAGRAAVLKSFLKRPRIYTTAPMFGSTEEAARRNMRAEISRLTLEGEGPK